MIEAARVGDMAQLERWIELKVDLNEQATDGYTALMLAAEKGLSPAVELLLRHKADPMLVSEARGFALWLAAANGHRDVCEMLLKAGAQKQRNVRFSERTPASAARERGHKDLATLIDVWGQVCSFFFAVCISHYLFVSRLFLMPVLQKYKAGDIILAAMGNDVPWLQRCIALGADVNEKNESDYTAIMRAAHYGHKEAVQFLIERNAKLNLVGAHGEFALGEAARLGHREVCEMLLKAGASKQPSTAPRSAVQEAKKEYKTSIATFIDSWGKVCQLLGFTDSGRLLVRRKLNTNIWI